MRECLLSDVADIESGAGFPMTHQGSQGEAFPFLKVSDMNLAGNERLILRWNNSISEEVRKKLRAKAFPSGALIFPKIGAAIATNKKRQLTRPSCVDNNVMAIIPKLDQLDPDYLYFLFRTKNLSDFASDSNPPSIRKSDVERWQIKVPPLPEQRRIVDLLSRAEGIVRLRREAEKKAAELIPALFLDMFGDPATNPKGWRKDSITAVCGSSDDIKCGPFGTQLAKSEFRHDGVPLWGIKHVNVGFSIPTVEFLSIEKAIELNAYSIRAGDIVMTRKGTIGNCALYRDGMPAGVMHSDLLRIRPDPNKCVAQFLSDQLHTSRDVEHQIARTASSGAVMPGINVGRLKAIQILIPPISLQRDYSEKIGQISSVQSQQSTASAKAQAAFDAMLAKAFSVEAQEA